MFSDDREPRRRPDRALTFGVLLGVMAALLPITKVVTVGASTAGAVVLTVAILIAGYIARRYRLALAVSLIEAAVWVVIITFVFFRDSALLWIIPTAESFRDIPALLTGATDEITLGAAPLDATQSLAFLLVSATGLLTIVIDHVVLTARMPLLASVGLIAVWLIPSIAVPTDVDVSGFVLLAISILFLMRTDTRSREAPEVRSDSRSVGVPATAIGIGAIAVIVTLIAAPLLPQPVAVAGSGVGTGPAIDPTLALGDDLRKPREIEVLDVRTNAASAPYLRAVTLSRFTGNVWQPDRTRAVPLSDEAGLAEVEVDPDIRVTEFTTKVELKNLSSPWLPVPYPAVSVTGLSGDWQAMPFNRTVLSDDSSAQGQKYEVVTHVPRPTLEQIRGRSAGGPDIRDETTQLPDDLPPIIAQTAAAVTAGTDSDYDALAAMQRWFRGGEFSYSLQAPVEDGFDGSGADAVAQFLKVKKGYCVHFASAFALMARTLGMPSRIVIGYLPGTNTTSAFGDDTVFAVSSSQLHAWPEVYFDGIGWVPFDPTNSLGSPTSFSAAATTPGDTGNDVEASPAPSASASGSAGRNPEDADQRPGDAATGSSTSSVNPWPALGVLAGILVALAIPALVRELLRRQLLAAARTGDAAAAWTSVQDVAIDLGIPVSASESPRVLGARLVAEYGAPPEAMTMLVRAIERASYSADGRHGFGQGTVVADAAAETRAGLLGAAAPTRRVLAVSAPRSLVVRPGSIYAGAGTGAGAR